MTAPRRVSWAEFRKELERVHPNVPPDDILVQLASQQAAYTQYFRLWFDKEPGKIYDVSAADIQREASKHGDN